MDKLKELTDKLYQEGLSKGRQEGEAILADAKKEAAGILDTARKQAEAIKEQAEKEAADYRAKVESDLKMAARQSLQATRKDIETMIGTRIADEGTKAALSNEAFAKEVITAIAKAFSTQESKDLTLILPESLQASLEPFVNGELARILGSRPTVEFSKKIAGGLSIGPGDGSWLISLTDETFRSLMAEYLRPTARKLLFDEER